jgi:hypothetical protein
MPTARRCAQCRPRPRRTSRNGRRQVDLADDALARPRRADGLDAADELVAGIPEKPW